MTNQRNELPNPKVYIPLVILAIIIGILIMVGSRFYIAVPPGHVAVAALFGDVQKVHYKEGLHIPVNPLYKFYLFDSRQKTHMETTHVPTQDQLQTRIDVSIQYRLIGEMAPNILKNTGDVKQTISVHLVPKVRSLLREQGKAIKRAEDFFLEKTQENLQVALEFGLREYLQPMGIEIQAVLIRDITLPPFIVKAIEAKKEREQAVERQKAELERFSTEQQQKVATAMANRKAAEQQAEKLKVLADAQAYEIIKLNEAISTNPAYLQLQALETLKAMSNDKATKIYFLDGDSPNPLPLMHMGDVLKEK